MGFNPQQGLGQIFGGGGQDPRQQEFMSLLSSFLGGQQGGLGALAQPGGMSDILSSLSPLLGAAQQGGFGGFGGQGEEGEIDEELLMSLLGEQGGSQFGGGSQGQGLLGLLGGGSLGGFFNGGG